MTLSLFHSLRRGCTSTGSAPYGRKYYSLALLLLSCFCFAAFSSALPSSAEPSEDIVFLKALFIKEVRGYGLYAEEETNRFHKTDKPTVYLEVDSFQLGIKGEEYHISLSLDLLVKDANKKIVAEDKQIISHEYILKSRVRDVWFTVILDLSAWPEGKHILSWVVTDNTSGKQCTRDMEIEIY